MYHCLCFLTISQPMQSFHLSGLVGLLLKLCAPWVTWLPLSKFTCFVCWGGGTGGTVCYSLTPSCLRASCPAAYWAASFGPLACFCCGLEDAVRRAQGLETHVPFWRQGEDCKPCAKTHCGSGSQAYKIRCATSKDTGPRLVDCTVYSLIALLGEKVNM